MIKFRSTSSNIIVEIAKANNTISLSGRLMKFEIVPQNIQWLQVLHFFTSKSLKIMCMGAYLSRICVIIWSTRIRQRGTWKGPLKVLPLQAGRVGLPSRRR